MHASENDFCGLAQVEPPSEALVAAVVAATERCLPQTTALSLSIIVFNLAKLCRQHDASHAEHARQLMSLCYPLLEQVGHTKPSAVKHGQPFLPLSGAPASLQHLALTCAEGCLRHMTGTQSRGCLQVVEHAMQPHVLEGFNRCRTAMFCRGLARMDFVPSRHVVSTMCTQFEAAPGPVSRPLRHALPVDWAASQPLCMLRLACVSALFVSRPATADPTSSSSAQP